VAEVAVWKRVVLTPRIFAALASPERIRVLRALEDHNMTGTEVAERLTLSKSTAFKELSRLEEAQLVARIEGNRKWVYYRLTEIARRILHPEDVIVTFASEGEPSASGSPASPPVPGPGEQGA
jgi:DNA-binding transcriptional ArsR family regulator